MANRVGYSPDDKKRGHLKFNDAASAGLLVGASTRFMVQPFDVLKIRYQLQVEQASEAKYRSLRGMVATISSEEGLAAFWKGHMTAQYLTMIYMAVQVNTSQLLVTNGYLQLKKPPLLSPYRGSTY